MAQIRMSPDQMRSRAGEYRAEAEKVSDVITKMDNLVESLLGEWEGAASEGFASRYAELKPGFQQAENLIREIAGALDSSANIVENADSDIAGQFRG